MNVLNLIGNTPLVEIKKLNPNPKVKIFAKLEKFNPGGSVKDRIALYMIEAAEKSGKLTKDKIVLEPTSGNTGIGLTIVAAVKGYRIKIVMPESMSKERSKILKALGAELILTPAEEGMDGAILQAREMAKDKRYFMPDQFRNPANVQAHYETTGPEIWKQTDGKVTHFVAGLGTTGTLMGVSRRLKEYNPKIKIIGAEPHPSSKIQGLKNLDVKIVPGIFDASRLDDVIKVSDRDAFRVTRELAMNEGLFMGMSSGAAMWVAMKIAKQLESGTIVVLFPDGGEKYLNTNLFNDKK